MAMGDPEAVPAGRYAREWMEMIPCDGGTLWSEMQGLVVPAPDVRAALGLVLADPRIVGIVYRTDWISVADRLDSLFEVTGGPTITYVAATLVRGPHPDGAERFRRYLLGPVASDIFARHGFTHINRSAAR
jgi:ABC-type molybdate transport system substrate-binding protein